MKTEDLIKWALIAGAAYMVYRYLAQSGIFNALLPGAALQPTVTGGAGTSTSTGASASLDATTIYNALKAAIVAAGADPAAPLNGWDAAYWWARSSIYNGVDFIGPGQLGIVPMDATTAVAEAARLDLATMSGKIATYLASHKPGVAGLIAAPAMVNRSGQMIDMEAGFGGFTMPSPWIS